MDLDECVLITDSTLSFLSSHCPNLSSLSLSHCELITDDGIKLLGQSSAARDKLQILELDNCPLISDRGSNEQFVTVLPFNHAMLMLTDVYCGQLTNESA